MVDKLYVRFLISIDSDFIIIKYGMESFREKTKTNVKLVQIINEIQLLINKINTF